MAASQPVAGAGVEHQRGEKRQSGKHQSGIEHGRFLSVPYKIGDRAYRFERSGRAEKYAAHIDAGGAA
jgi:hypothetical protein